MEKNNFIICNLRTLLCCLATFAALMLAVGCSTEETSAPVQAKPVKKAATSIQAAITSEKKVEYVYDPTRKRDPFKTYIEMEKKVIGNRQAAILTPLQLLDLSDFRLVGVIVLPKKKVAMIEDPTGKGYNVKEGTLIGKNEGVVIEIRKDEVVVEEKYLDETSKIKTRNSFLKIQREQGGEVR